MDTVRKIFLGAAITCGAAWLVKVGLIGPFGGAEADNGSGAGVIAFLWALGLLGLLVAAGTGTVLLAGRAPVWVRVLLGVLAVPVAFAVMSFVDTAVKGVYGADGWFRDELSLVLIAGAMVVAATWLLSRMREPGS
jgi:hypothetical protein